MNTPLLPCRQSLCFHGNAAYEKAEYSPLPTRIRQKLPQEPKDYVCAIEGTHPARGDNGYLRSPGSLELSVQLILLRLTSAMGVGAQRTAERLAY